MRDAAQAADLVFAKEELARWCERLGVEHVLFTHLAEVHAALSILEPPSAVPRPREGR